MPNQPALNKVLWAATILVLLQAGLYYSASSGDSLPLPVPLAGFPQVLGAFHGTKDGAVEPETVAILRADDLLVRWYSSDLGSASLFMAYFNTQRSGQSPHSPKNCLPGEGFQPSENGTVDVQAGGETLRINRYLVSRGDETTLVMYWYQSSKRVIADEFAAKFYLVADSIATHRSNTSLVRVMVPVVPGHTDAADRTAIAFVKELYPAIRDFMPKS
jgi:EpsI family protein